MVVGHLIYPARAKTADGLVTSDHDWNNGLRQLPSVSSPWAVQLSQWLQPVRLVVKSSPRGPNTRECNHS